MQNNTSNPSSGHRERGEKRRPNTPPEKLEFNSHNLSKTNDKQSEHVVANHNSDTNNSSSSNSSSKEAKADSAVAKAFKKLFNMGGKRTRKAHTPTDGLMDPPEDTQSGTSKTKKGSKQTATNNTKKSQA